MSRTGCAGSWFWAGSQGRFAQHRVPEPQRRLPDQHPRGRRGPAAHSPRGPRDTPGAGWLCH